MAKPQIIEAAEGYEKTAAMLLEWAKEPNCHFLDRKLWHDEAARMLKIAAEYRTWSTVH